ncbi:hypothetical protein AMR41_24460 [Hapalosiphon sp. MRB220]|nr:hypothetical protein AMR41_24460 [Hapalosiphon sp. MRB220]
MKSLNQVFVITALSLLVLAGCNKGEQSTMETSPTASSTAASSTAIEPLYQYHLTDNISITPSVIWLTAPDHNSTNDHDLIGVLRITFTF